MSCPYAPYIPSASVPRIQDNFLSNAVPFVTTIPLNKSVLPWSVHSPSTDARLTTCENNSYDEIRKMYSRTLFTAFLVGCEIAVAAVAHARTGTQGLDGMVIIEENPVKFKRWKAETRIRDGWDPSAWGSMPAPKPATQVSSKKPDTTEHKTMHHKSKVTKKPSPHSDSSKRPKSSEHAESATHPKVSQQPKSSTHHKQLAHSKSSTYKAAPSTRPTGYAEIITRQHNVHRANHSAPEIQWSDDLAATANTIASSCVYAHNTATNGGGYGQNIAAGTPPDQVSAVITNLFYNGEVNWYDSLYGEAQPDMTNFEHWGHFSQIVWKDTSHVGCATKHCPGGLGNVGSDVAPYFTVCNYKSPGNFADEYGKNIGRPLGYPTVHAGT